ncbi:MAG: hypothetical protein RH981_06495 [Arenibacter sp.]
MASLISTETENTKRDAPISKVAKKATYLAPYASNQMPALGTKAELKKVPII